MKKFVVFSCLFFFVFAAEMSFAQVKIDSTEITSRVPELTDFHDIIYPMWHNAYPAKDIKTLREYVPQIKVSMEAINNAVLPGILKDKEADWKGQLKEFNTAAENYYKAAEGNDDEAMLVAAEKLHFQYEMMIRVIRPVLKEIDDYHQTLYIIYHKLYPDKQYDEIAKMMDNLVEKAGAIAQYPPDKLKKRLGENFAKFEPASKELYDATVALKYALNGTDPLKKDEAVQHMHTMYQNLESVFE
jgi:hypothetical protein